ncbi:MAG: type IV secretory system conjugative DNA transfer family protein, partial [Alphaproteobacteria bacterium]
MVQRTTPAGGTLPSAKAPAPAAPAKLLPVIGWARADHDKDTPSIGFTRKTDRERTKAIIETILLKGEGHLMTVAPTGAGKGVRCIIPALLSYEGSAIVIDPKGENHAVTARRRREMGHTVHVLDPFGVTGPATDALNPLDLIKADEPDALDDADVLAGLLLQGRTSLRDPFWDDMARDLIRSLILYVASDSPKALRNLPEVEYLLSMSARDFDLTLKDMARSRNPMVQRGASAFASAEPKVAASIRSTAQQHSFFLRSPQVAQTLYRTFIDVEGLCEGKAVTVYIVIPPNKLASHGKLLRLWVGALLNLLTKRTRKPKLPTLFLLDEAAQLGTLAQLTAAVTLMRGYGVKTWTFWQDLDQLEALYPADSRTLINNCATHMAFGLTTLTGAKKVANAFGYERKPRELLKLKSGEMLLSRAGQAPVVAQLPDYLTERRFAGLFDPNPYHAPRPPEAEKDCPLAQGSAPEAARVRPEPSSPRLRLEDLRGRAASEPLRKE